MTSSSSSSLSILLSQLMDPNSSITETFIASLRSVGAACMLALVGIYLHRRGFIVGEGKKTLALICQQALIPTYLCVKTMYCDQNNSSQSCPDVVKSLNQIWVLLIWPAYVVSVGAICAFCCSKIIKPPKKQIKAMYAAIMFGNSTALPITMLTVVHSNFPRSSILGKVDPTLFLSIYLLLYPVLQWGIGGWLLAPDEYDEEELTNGKTSKSSYGTLNTSSSGHGSSTIAEESSGAGSGSGGGSTTSSSSTGGGRSPATPDYDHENIELLREHEFETARVHDQEARRSSSSSSSITSPRVFRHVVNILPNPPGFIIRSSTSADEYDHHRKSVSLDTLKVNVHQSGAVDNSQGSLTTPQGGRDRSSSTGGYGQYTDVMGMDNSQGMGDRREGFGLRTRRSIVHVPAYEMTLEQEGHNPIAPHQTGYTPVDPFVNFIPRHNSILPSLEFPSYEFQSGDAMVANKEDDLNGPPSNISAYETTHFWNMFFKIMERVFQPPCVGALLGLGITAFPNIRGLFIDMENRADDAPLEWMYDALLQVGQASIPIIMIVL